MSDLSLACKCGGGGSRECVPPCEPVTMSGPSAVVIQERKLEFEMLIDTM